MEARVLSFLTLCCLLVSFSGAEISAKVGINYGLLGNNLPSPERSVQLIIKHLNAKRVKIYGANPEILTALKHTGIQVSIMVPNELIVSVSTNQTLADEWVRLNVVPFYPHTAIRYLLVGNEILSQPDKKIWYGLVPAMRKVKKALKSNGVRKVKVGTPLAMDMLEASYPPSAGAFRSDIAEPVIRPMLQFLNRTKSFFFVDVYPYFAWAAEPKNINLDYALLQPTNITIVDPNTGLLYTNLFEQMLDAVVFAMKRLGYPSIRIFIAETGWPNAGDVDQIGANIYNAATYNRNVVRRLTAKPVIGTPARPFAVIPSFLFALYNENIKPGPGTERHFGLLYPNGRPVYPIDLSGKTPSSVYPPLPAPENNEPYKGKIWCVVSREARRSNQTEVAAALAYACSQGNNTCDPIQPGRICSVPKSLVRQASYAFSAYWAKFRKVGGTCYFNRLAVQTTKDPSYGYCKYPSVTL